MKNLKKVLALGLSATMVSSMFVTAGAAFTDQADIKSTDAVNMLSALGVINGYEDGSYKPETVVTRAEMAKMIFVVRNNQVDDSAYQNFATKFTDIKGHWAAGYIKFCESQGIIAGKTATQFDPDAPVTGVEAAKMLLVLTGYTPDKAGLTGSMWATNTLKWAAEAGILDDVNSALEQGLPRQYAAQEIYNTLDAYRVKWSTDSNSFDYFQNGGVQEKVGRKYMGLYSSVGTLVSVAKQNLTLTNVEGAESDPISTSTSGATVTYQYGTDFSKVTTDYSNMLGQKVKIMFKDGKTNTVLGVYPTSDNTIYTANANSVEPDGEKVKVNGSSYSMKVTTTDATPVTVNDKIAVYYTDVDGTTTEYTKNTGSTVKDASYFDDLDQSANMLTFVDSDADSKLDTAIITEYAAAKVTYASASQIVAGGVTYKYADDKIADGIQKDDWVVVSYDRFNDCQKVTKADKITGKLTATKTGTLSTKATFNKYSIDGTWYNVATNGTVKGNQTDLNTVKAGDSVEAVAVNGVLYYVKRTSTATNGNISDVAMILDTDTVVGTKKASIALFDGTKMTVDIDSDTAVTLTPGNVYEYTVSGSDYKFTNLLTGESANKEQYSDFTAYDSSLGLNAAKDEVTGVESSAKIDDSAKVLLYADNDRKAITGKQFKALDFTAITVVGVTSAFKGDMGGLTRIGAMTVEVSALPDTLTTKDNYAYILDDAVKTGSDTVSYPIWNGTQKIDATEKFSGNLSERAAGTVIGYKSIDTANSNKLDDVTVMNMGVARISDKSADGKTLNLVATAAKALADTTLAAGEHDIVNDTTVFYVNSDNDYNANEEGGNIGIAGGSVNTSDYTNVLYLLDGTDFELVVIDVQGKFVDSPYAVNDGATTATLSGDMTNSAKLQTNYGTALNTTGTTGTLTLSAVASTTAATLVNVELFKNGTSVAKADSTVTSDGITVTADDVAKNGKTSALKIVTGTTTSVGTYKAVFTVADTTTEVTFTVDSNKVASLAAITTADNTVVNAAGAPINGQTVGAVAGAYVTNGTANVTASYKIKLAGGVVVDSTKVLATGDMIVVTATFEPATGCEITATAAPALKGATADSFNVNADGTATATYTLTVVSGV